MSNKPNPYRTHLKTASGEEPHEIIRLTTEERLELRLAKSFTFEDAELWLSHPDERVTLEFLEEAEKHSHKAPTEYTVDFYAFIIEELLKRADKAGEAWNPLLSFARPSFYWGHLKEDSKEQVIAGVATPQEQLAKGVDWIKTALPNELDALVQSPPQPEVLEFIAEHARAFTFEQLEKIVHPDSATSVSWGFVNALLRNKNLTPLVKEWLAEKTVYHSRNSRDSQETFQAFNNDGYDPPTRLVERLVVEPYEERKRTSGEISSFGQHRFLDNLSSLLEFKGLSEDNLTKLGVVLEGSGAGFSHRWSEISTHPSAPASIVLRVLKEELGQGSATIIVKTCEAIAGRPELQDVPEIWKLFVRKASWESLVMVLDKLTDAERALLKERLHRESYYNVMKWVKNQNLSKDDVVVSFLLTHPDRKVRLALLDIVPELERKMSKSGPEKRGRSR